MSAEPGLELQQMEICAPGGKRLVEQLSLHIPNGSFVAFIGPSGVGKSTLFRVLAGLHRESSGVLRLQGVPLRVEQRLGQIVYMPQQDELLPWLTAAQNAALGLRLRGVALREARAQVAHSLEMFGLADVGSLYPQQLSGGMRQRVAFMRTLLTDAGVVLLDEPFSALDRMTRTHMQSWLLDIWQQQSRTVMMITHDIEEAMLLADEVYVWPATPGAALQQFVMPFARARTREVVFSEEFVALRRRLEAVCFAKEATHS